MKAVLLGASWLTLGAAAAYQAAAFASAVGEVRSWKPLVVELEPAPRVEPSSPKPSLAYYASDPFTGIRAIGEMDLRRKIELDVDRGGKTMTILHPNASEKGEA